MLNRHDSLSHPCFLVGAERSGTTMLRLMLDHHPQIAFLGEYEFMVDYLPPNGWPAMHEYEAYLRTNRVYNHWKLTADFTLDYPDLMRSLLVQGSRNKPFHTIGATVHSHFDRLPRIWPEARYIHILRDPRDVALSVVQMGWAGNVWAGAHVWLEAEETWERLRDRLRDDQWTELRFEDLVTNPRDELDRLCRFLDLSYDGNMLDYGKDTTYAAPDPGVAFKWKRKYPTGGASLVEQRIGALLARRGYESGAGPTSEPRAVSRLRLRVENKIGKILFAGRRYGWRLYLADLFARKTGLRPIAERCQTAKWAIDEANLK